MQGKGKIYYDIVDSNLNSAFPWHLLTKPWSILFSQQDQKEITLKRLIHQKAHGYADKAIYFVLTIFQYVKVIAIIRQADKSGTFALFQISSAESNVAFFPTLMTKAFHALVKRSAAFFILSGLLIAPRIQHHSWDSC